MGLDRVPSGKVNVLSWLGVEEARQEIMNGVNAYVEAKEKPAF